MFNLDDKSITSLTEEQCEELFEYALKNDVEFFTQDEYAGYDGLNTRPFPDGNRTKKYDELCNKINSFFSSKDKAKAQFASYVHKIEEEERETLYAERASKVRMLTNKELKNAIHLAGLKIYVFDWYVTTAIKDAKSECIDSIKEESDFWDYFFTHNPDREKNFIEFLYNEGE